MIEEQRFNKDFFTKKGIEFGKGLGGDQTRDQDCGHYYRVADFVRWYFHGLNMIEIGSGMGWITKHLKTHGQSVVGFDIGKWAVDNAVCDDIFHADLLTIDTKKWQREMVVCSNVMAYFEEEEIPLAIQQLGKLFTKYAFVVLQTRENMVKNWGEEIVINEKARRTLRPWDWWKEQFETQGLVLGKKHYSLAGGENIHARMVPNGDGKPTMFILEHI